MNVDPINPSVGVMIDDVDFSGIGNAGTLFDISQVEILGSNVKVRGFKTEKKPPGDGPGSANALSMKVDGLAFSWKRTMTLSTLTR